MLKNGFPDLDNIALARVSRDLSDVSIPVREKVEMSREKVAKDDGVVIMR